jgi:EmrB/QacA subfamily drug resistance transporter
VAVAATGGRDSSQTPRRRGELSNAIALTRRVVAVHTVVEAPPRGSERGAWLAFAACLVAVFMQMVDLTIVNTALPSVARELHASASNQLLVITVYTLAFACTLMTCARLGEWFGRRMMFLAAMAAFTAASALCGMAGDVATLIAARGLQGVSAAAMSAQTIAIIAASFRPARHPAVFGAYGAVAGLAGMAGPAMGGLLIAGNVLGLGWRTIFLLNVPLGMLALVLSHRHLHVGRSATREKLDPIGMALSTAGLFGLIYPLVCSCEGRWQRRYLVMIAAAAAILAVFVGYERALARRGGNPLLRRELFADRAFGVGAVLSMGFFGMFAAFLLMVSITTQYGLRYTAMRTGVLMVPFAVGAAVGSVGSPLLVRRWGTWTLTAGIVVFGTSLAVIAALLDPASGTLDVAAVATPVATAGLGMGLFVAPLQATVMSATTDRTVGSASGLLPTIQQLGSSIGVAAMSVVFFHQIAAHAAPAVSQARTDVIATLATAHVPVAQRYAIADDFSQCVTGELASAYPQEITPICDSGRRSAHPSQAQARLAAAAQTAAARAFLSAGVVMLWVITGVAALLAGVTAALPRRAS